MAKGHLPANLEAAFSSGRALPFLLLQVDLPDVSPPLCLLSGSGEVAWNGETFKGTDDRFGALGALDPPEDGAGDEAPSMSFDIAAVSDAAATTLAAAAYQGSRVQLWVSAVIDETGAIADPYRLFDGILDVPSLEIDRGSRTLTLECVSGFELLFSDTEGQRLAHESHKEIWPGENAFQWITGVNRSIIWGPGERPNNPLAYANGGGSYPGRGGREGVRDRAVRSLLQY